MKTVVLKVAAWNSTVLGRRARADHDAREWFDGWKNLGVHSPRSYVDGCPRKLTGKQRINFFGAGRVQGLSCGQYLHAPVLGKGADRRVYRVRCRFKPGLKYRGQVIHSVSLERRGKFWYWKIAAGSGGGREAK